MLFLWMFHNLVGKAGIEPARSFEQEVLSLRCLPFHHLPMVRVQGFEPRFTDSKSAVLPLDDTRVLPDLILYQYITTFIAQRFLVEVSAHFQPIYHAR